MSENPSSHQHTPIETGASTAQYDTRGKSLCKVDSSILGSQMRFVVLISLTNLRGCLSNTLDHLRHTALIFGKDWRIGVSWLRKKEKRKEIPWSGKEAENDLPSFAGLMVWLLETVNSGD